MTKPLAFIDVDGVLNRMVSNDVAKHRGYITSTVTPTSWPMRLKVHLDPADRGRLERLGEYFDLAWGTTWEHDACTLIAPRIGIGHDWPVAINNGMGATKAPGIVELADGRPFVWLDDDISPEDESICRRAPGLILLVHVAANRVTKLEPDEPTGLTGDHVEQAITWAKALEVVG